MESFSIKYLLSLVIVYWSSRICLVIFVVGFVVVLRAPKPPGKCPCTSWVLHNSHLLPTDTLTLTYFPCLPSGPQFKINSKCQVSGWGVAVYGGGAPGLGVLLCGRLTVQEGGCGGWSSRFGGSESRLPKGLRMGGRWSSGQKVGDGHISGGE